MKFSSAEQNRIKKKLVEQCMTGNVSAIKLYFALRDGEPINYDVNPVIIVDDIPSTAYMGIE